MSDGEAMVDAAIAQGQLTAVLGNFASTVDIHVLWKRQLHLSPRVRYMVDQLVACAEAGKPD